MKRWNLIRREIKNYFYLRRILSRESKTTNAEHPWVKYKLRKNWYGRIYTVVSLREEDMGEEEVVRNWKAMEMMRPINEYLTSLDLQEIVFPSIEKIPDSRSYLVVYSPLFNNLSFGWVFWRFMLLVFLASVSYIIYSAF